MDTVKVGEFKTHFSRFLQRVQAGEEIIISFGKKGEKVAVLVPYRKYKQGSVRHLGLLKGKASCKIKPDFEMSDEEFLSA